MWSLTVILLEPGIGSLSDLTQRMKNVEVEDLMSICLVPELRVFRANLNQILNSRRYSSTNSTKS